MLALLRFFNLMPHPNHELKAPMAPNHDIEEEISYAVANVAVTMIISSILKDAFKKCNKLPIPATESLAVT